jgi:3-oxoacyl-[acyl-carrier protein] reductase
MTELEFNGKIALVTGASRGVGRAIALKFAALGAKVAVNYLRSEDQANAVVAQIVAAGGEAIAVRANVADAAEVKAMFATVLERWQRVDILVNNAGITRDTMMLRMSEEDWDEVIDINLRGAYLCTKFALKSMTMENWGRIVNIASLGGIVGNQGQANYSASKGGLIAFTKAVAREVAPRQVTANAIAPGFVVTEMTDAIPKEMQENILARIPLKRFGEPADIAELAAFLASERASYITAQVIGIDGGVI